MGDGILHVVGIDELLFQFLPFLRVGLERERVGEEVVGSRVLVHTPHQITDGVEEVLLLHHRSIEDYVVAQLLLSPPNVVGHTFEHLEAEAVLRRVIHLRQQIGV